MGRQSVFCQIFYSLSQLKRASLEHTGCGSFIVSVFYFEGLRSQVFLDLPIAAGRTIIHCPDWGLSQDVGK